MDFELPTPVSVDVRANSPLGASLPSHREFYEANKNGQSVETLASKYGLTPRMVRVRITKGNPERKSPHEAALSALPNSGSNTNSQQQSGGTTVPGVPQTSAPTVTPKAIVAGCEAIHGLVMAVTAHVKKLGSHSAIDKYSHYKKEDKELLEGLAPLVQPTLQKWFSENQDSGIYVFCGGLAAISFASARAMIAEVRKDGPISLPKPSLQNAPQTPIIPPKTPMESISSVSSNGTEAAPLPREVFLGAEIKPIWERGPKPEIGDWNRPFESVN